MTETRQETAKTSRSWIRRAARLLVVLAIPFLALLGILMLFENSLIFFPSKYPNGYWEPTDIDFEDAHFTSADGTKLHGWYFPHDDPNYAILFCHGNAGNITNRVDAAAQLREKLGASVFVFDYRGYGKSEGSPNEKGVLADARAARTWLAKHEKIKPEEIVLLGRSLGGAVAVDLAANDGAKALLLQSTFTSVPDVGAYHYPVPRWLIRTQLDSLSKIGDYQGPVFSSHGNDDSIIPYEFGKQLYEAAPGEKEFMTLEGFDHNDSQPEEYYELLKQFMEKNVGKTP